MLDEQGKVIEEGLLLLFNFQKHCLWKRTQKNVTQFQVYIFRPGTKTRVQGRKADVPIVVGYKSISTRYGRNCSGN